MSLRGHVLIGGGTGFIGRHLRSLLKNKGYGVTVVSRKPGNNQLTWRDIQSMGIPPEVTSVVNLSGQNILDAKYRWNDSFKKLVVDSRVDTTKALAKAIINTNGKISSFIVSSGVGIYVPSEIQIYTESSPVKEFDFFSNMCMQIEHAGRLPAHLNCRQIAIRNGVVLGRDGGIIQNLYVPFFLGLGGPVLPGNQPLPWIHIADACHLILHAIENPKANGPINGVAPQIIDNTEFSKAFGKALNRPAVIPLPSFVLKTVFGNVRADMLLKGQKVQPQKALELGYKFIFPDISKACQNVITTPSPHAL